MSEREFDVVVLGAGPAGEVLAGRLGEAGKRVAIVEPDLVGGECSYYACMPSKALLRPSQALAEARRVPGAAEAASGELDVEAALARRDEVIHDLDDSGQEPWLEERGIELIRASGRLDGERRVVAGDETLVATEAVVVATGSGPAVPPVDGLDEVAAWSNREATTASEAPESLLVLGGGVVGVELAQAWATLGSRVVLIEGEDRLISREEPFASEEIRDGLEAAGVDVRTGVLAESAGRSDDGVTLALGDGSEVSGQQILVAVGRRPHTDEIGLETIGLDPGEFIAVDETLRVPELEWLYAIGDVNGRSLLTHSGKYQARLAADRILGGSIVARSDDENAPRVIFTEPQVAAVGRTLAGAKEAAIPAEAVDMPTDGNAGASFTGKGAGGTTRFVVDTDRHVLVGATFVGPDVAEMLQAATIAVTAEVPLTTLAHAIAPFPTRSEHWLKLVEDYEKRHPEVPIHSS